MLFIHIPKTGGYTIRQNPFVRSYVHHTALEVRAMYPLFNQTFKFTFVRNPYDRLVSAYHYYHQMGPEHPFWHLEADRKTATAIKKYPSFQSFVKGLPKFKYRTRIHFLPQWQWVYDGDTLLVDYVGRFEAYEHGWATACLLGNVPYDPLPVLNESKHYHWATYYTDELYSLVYEQYKEDFKRFGYNR